MQLTDLNWPAIQSLDKDTPVVFPIAALEQHGNHLPVFTDSLILGEIVTRLQPDFESSVLFAPLQWLGHSEHHLDFPGTLSAPGRVYIDMLRHLMDNFIAHGFRRLVFLNGHGGNQVPGQQAITEARHEHSDRDDLLLLFATYWQFADDSELKDIGCVQDHMGHACEWETSMMLHIAPELVGDIQKLESIPQEDRFEPATRAWRTRDKTPFGHIGEPSEGSREKGRQLLDAFTRGTSRWLKGVVDNTGNAA